VMSGVYAMDSSSIKVDHNSFLNVQGPGPRGQFVQFNRVNGKNNRITCNTGKNVLGESDAEDAINLHQSNGDPSDPIQIMGNKVEGGGPSPSGGGILLGDGGGSNQIAKDNILVDPGQYGVAAAGGNNLQLVNNSVYGKRQSFTNVGLYVWNQYGGSCYGITAQGNSVRWTNKDGVTNPSFNGGNCGSINGWSNNFWNASIGPEILDREIPACAAGPSDSTKPTVSITSPANNQSVSGTVSISAAASDNVRVASVSFRIDGSIIGSASSAPFGASLDTKTLSNGSHTITAVGTDAAGNTGSSSPVTIQVNNPTGGGTGSNNGSVTLSSEAPWRMVSNGWGPVERDRSNGQQGAGDGRTITLNGVPYAKGLGVHARSEIRYSLNGACSTFGAMVGVDDEVGTSGSVVFQVLADGAKLFDSGVLRGSSAAKRVDVNLTGKRELTLIVTDAGDGIAYDHADWAIPQLVCNSGSATPAPTPAPTTPAYVSDLAWTSVSNGYGPVEKDKSNGEQAAGDGRTLMLNGVSYSKGLGVHGRSEIKYSLGGRCTTFTANVGVDDEVGSSGSVVFQVLVDGSSVYNSGLMRGSTATKSVSVDLTGKSQLSLVVTDGGDGPSYDHADWANARLNCR
ncbi:MAG: NPCBM/NEW2 domain-containing protein, partial [Bryobacteraceae bacterium]